MGLIMENLDKDTNDLISLISFLQKENEYLKAVLDFTVSHFESEDDSIRCADNDVLHHARLCLSKLKKGARK